MTASISTKPDELYFVALGGAGEIGMNLNLFGHRGKWLMVDLGVTFGDDQAPGVDVIMPDPGFIAERAGDLVGLILTHAHEDHIGAVQYLWPQLRCPIYATAFTASVLRRKLAETGLEEAAKITIVPAGGSFSVGPFDIEYVTLTHSIPEPNGLAIRTSAGTIFHTGDWKLDPDPLVGPVTDEQYLRDLGEEGVLALIGDSTNALRAGTSGSEADVRRHLVDLVSEYDKRVVITCFASNVARVETIAKVAEATGRHAALAGRSMWRIHDAARENGYLDNLPPFLSEEDAAHLPRDRVLIACTGSQGEPRAALTRVATDQHPHITLEAGDAVIFSSRIIPGNEKSIGRLHNHLIRKGLDVITERDHFVHVSGHPARDELIRMYQWIRPKIAVPVHGEGRHLLEHARIARQCQVGQTVIAENGTLVRLAPGVAETVGEVPTGRLAVDGKVLVDLSAVTRARNKLIYNGAVVVTMVVDDAGDMMDDPMVSLQGLPDGGGALNREVALAIREFVEDLPDGAKTSDKRVEEAARRAVRQTINDEIGKRPVIDIHLVRI
ncbi:MAG: ribonuclease J [Alphaproteobacteria bacterium]|nr:ribonuclease J [Alphaproteobacteria bacterium]